jgi:predicted amidophosphoribosyltransferase
MTARQFLFPKNRRGLIGMEAFCPHCQNWIPDLIGPNCPFCGAPFCDLIIIEDAEEEE